MATTVFKSVKEVINQETGELVSLERHSVKKVKYDEFIQVYLNDIAGLLQIDSVSEIKVLMCLWKEATFTSTNEELKTIIVTRFVKDKWVQETNVKLQSINNALCSLVKKGLLYSPAKTAYVLNPNYFFKGPISDRAKAIKHVVEYRIEKG
jgi:hypothetical protein